MSSHTPTFTRRLGPPGRTISNCVSLKECPDIFELADGDFAIIGADITSETAARLPPDAGCGARERIVRIPRALLVQAKSDIPNA